jgi:hypothetical protein
MVFFHGEFEIARGTRAVYVCNFSGKNIRDVHLHSKPIFRNPVELVRKLSTSKLANNIYRIFQLGTVPALARMVAP